MARKIRASRYLLVFSLLATVILVGCATTQKVGPVVKAGDLTAKMNSGKYIQKANNFDIIVDKTGSMAAGYKGVEKFSIEKSLVSKFNSYIPDVPLNGGLRTLGQNYADFDVTKMMYGMTKYDANNLEGVIQSLRTPYGDTPLEKAILAAGNDMKGLQGKSALVIFSDGVDQGDAPVKAAANVKSQYGDKLCIYTVLIGDDKQGAKVLDQVAKAGQCGVAVKGDDLASDSAMNAFVEEIFLAPKPAEKPAPTPAPVPAPAPEVKHKILEKGRATLDVEFDFDKAVVKEKYYKDIQGVAEVMKKNPDLKIVVEGHTDNVGGKQYNLNLSKKRAEAVKEVMVKKFNIGADRVKAEGFGFSKPIASNVTKEGRQKNRRVEAAVDYTYEK